MSIDPLIERLERIHQLSHEKIVPITEKQELRGRTATLVKRTALAVYGSEAITLFDGDTRAVGLHKEHQLTLCYSPVLRSYSEPLRPGETNPPKGVFVTRLDKHPLPTNYLFSDPCCVHGPDYGHSEPAKNPTQVCMHEAHPVPHSRIDFIAGRKLTLEHNDGDSRTEYTFYLTGHEPTKHLLHPTLFSQTISLLPLTPDDDPVVHDVTKLVMDRTYDLLDRVVGEAQHENALMHVDGLACHGTRVVLSPQAYEIRKGADTYRLHRLKSDVPRLQLGRLNIHVGNEFSTIPIRIDVEGAFTLADDHRALLDAAGTVYQLAGEEERDIVKVTLGVMPAADYEAHQQDKRVKQMRVALTDLLARMRGPEHSPLREE